MTGVKRSPERASKIVQSHAEDRRVARDPATDPAELRRLFTQRGTDNPSLKEDLAYNPHTPLGVLAQLLEDAPSACCRNPSAPSLSLEIPEFAKNVSPLGIVRMLRYPRAPSALVNQIARSIRLPDYLVKAAQQHLHYRPLIADDAWALEIRRFLRNQVRSITEKYQKERVMELVELGAIPAEMATALGKWDLPNPEDYETVRRRLRPDLRRQLEQGYAHFPVRGPVYYEKYKQPYIFIGAAFNPTAPQSTLLSWCPMVAGLAETIARNPKATTTALTALAQHPDPTIRRMVLRNPACPPEAVQACQRKVYAGMLRGGTRSIMRHWELLPEPWSFTRILALLHAPEPVRRPYFRKYALSHLWEDRLAAAIAMDHRPNGQPMKPMHRVLLEQLANDGICLVRAAAQARLRGETFSLEGA